MSAERELRHSVEREYGCIDRFCRSRRRDICIGVHRSQPIPNSEEHRDANTNRVLQRSSYRKVETARDVHRAALRQTVDP